MKFTYLKISLLIWLFCVNANSADVISGDYISSVNRPAQKKSGDVHNLNDQTSDIRADQNPDNIQSEVERPIIDDSIDENVIPAKENAPIFKTKPASETPSNISEEVGLTDEEWMLQQPTLEPEVKVAPMGVTKTKRSLSKMYVLGTYSLIDLLVPSKYGVTFGYVEKVSRTWEFEYLKGSLSGSYYIADIGSMDDQRFSILGRSYFKQNSFNVFYGLSYLKYSIRLGSDVISRMTAGQYQAKDLLEVDTIGAHIGIGNRWSFRNGFTAGIDWLSVAYPFHEIKSENAFSKYASDENDRKNVDKAIDIVGKFPRFVAFKVQIGYLF